MNSTITIVKPTPKVGDFLLIDERTLGTRLCEDDGFSDSGFPGCEFRTDENGLVPHRAINVKITGRDSRWCSKVGAFAWRCRVEFVGDCEPSTFVGGWLVVN